MFKLLLLCAFCVCVEGYKDARCQTRGGPHNGQVSYTVRDGGLVARFRCNSGYSLVGNPFAVCLGGIWRHPIPICLSKQDIQKQMTRKSYDTTRALILTRRRSGPNKLEQNDSPSPARKYRKTGNHIKKKKDKRKLKQKLKTKGSVLDGHQLEQDEEFLSKLDVSCLVGSGGAGFIKAPEVSHAVVKYARKRNERGTQNRYLLATYECVKGFTLKNKRNDRMFCSRSRWLGAKPKCQKQEAKEENSEFSLCGVNRGGCEHTCTEVRKKVICSCYHGFRAEGNRCLDIDECEINNGGCEHICKNQLGSFSCSCPNGLQLSSNGKTCVDINECLSRNGHGPCQDTCTNHWGGYQCNCDSIPGTQLSEDNHTCEDIDECKSGMAGCSHSCINALGRAFCQCPPGLELGEDWKTCQDVDECDDEAIESTCEFGCINTVGSYYCDTSDSENEVSPDTNSINVCLSGYRRDTDGKCIDIDECKENTHNCSHQCINREGDYECACPDGYDLSDNERTCDDYDECAEDIEPEHNCSQRCINEVGSYRCGCYNGYLLDVDRTTCLDIDECISSPCTHECKNLMGGFVCTCPEGYEITNRTTCTDIDECTADTHNCTHDCVNLSGHYTCTCPSGMSFFNESCVDVDECKSDNGNCSQLCQNSVGSYECKCLSGYRLLNRTECEDVDECTESYNYCSHGCENTPGSYFCYCRDGFTFNGNTCEDVNECLTDNGNCSHKCKNIDGGYECQCPTGYRLKDALICEELNECESENGGCSHECENTEGSFVCSCPDGYRLHSDERICLDIDECTIDNGNCSHICINIDGGFSCSCHDDFELQEDNRTCSERNLCQSENGGCSHICTTEKSEPGTVICSCFEGYLLGKDNKTCEDACSGCEHFCEEDGTGNKSCSCRDGYKLAEDQKNCTDLDECESSPCMQICLNMEGNFECDCHDGYRLNEKDNTTCLDVDECLEWEYDMEYYDNKIDYGEPKNLCSHTCVNLPGGYTCYCPQGYTLSEDDRTCTDVDECSLENGGCDHSCINHDGGYECQCERGYLLQNGTTCVDIDECSFSNGNCSQNCVNRKGGFDCYCLDSYVLAEDKRTCIRKCSIKNGLCGHFCTEHDGIAECYCASGHQLLPDNMTCSDINECELENGGCNQICNNTIGSFHCSCKKGYVLDGKECKLSNKCLIDNGDCSHVCKYEDGKMSCSCHDSYLLDTDGKTCVCPPGYFDTDRDCRDVDECLEGFSNCSDSCINTVGSYNCECPPGLQLAEDGKTCTDINECLRDNGGCSHECMNTIGSFICKCRMGFKVENKTTCIENNVCAHQNGGCEQVCESKNGKAECSCFEGYMENGTLCSDINECLGSHNCSQVCVNTLGSYKCKCNPGYYEDGIHCRDTDECSKGACPGKKCVNTIGSYHCECHPGYKLINDQCLGVSIYKYKVKFAKMRLDHQLTEKYQAQILPGQNYQVVNYYNESFSVLFRDINECITKRPCQGRCINTMGSYKCVCHTGFKEKNGACNDINECEFENGGCSHICINFQGSHKCVCPEGYESKNNSCQDINECDVSNGGCDHFCINTEGSYKCSCKDNFYLLDDRKSCKVSGKACPKLIPPPFGEIRCPQFPQLTREFPVHAECYARCHKGYKLAGDIQHTCTSSGEWSGKSTECIPLPCPKLRAPENGHFIPSSCTTGKSPPSHHCILACNKGYHVQGRAVLTCLTSQQWNSPIPVCTKDTPPPYIQCSQDISIELPSTKLSVYVKIPQPKSNVDWWRYVEAHPPWAKKLEGEFQLGTTTIMFRARNPTSNLTAACRLLIHVYDNEKPRVVDCPDSFAVMISPKETGRIVNWKEPTFSDNVKIEHINKTKEPGTLFKPGYHPIRYTATDSSGNKAVCNFTVTVKYDEKVIHSENKDSFRKIIVCPQLPQQGDFYQSYVIPTRCFVQRHRLTRVLTGFGDYQTYQNHGLRHQHDRTTLQSRLGGIRNYYTKRKESFREQEKISIDRQFGNLEKDNLQIDRPRYQGTIPYSHSTNGTILLDAQMLIDQKNHQSDLARWQEFIKKYHSSSIPSLTATSRERNSRLLEMETRRRYEEERLRNHEIEMMRWRENMKRYNLEMKRLQEDSRRYRAG